METDLQFVPLVIVNLDPDETVRVPEGCDLLELNLFLESGSRCGVDYDETDYVAYLRTVSEKIVAGARRWSDEDLDQARALFADSVTSVARRHGEEILDWYHDGLADAQEDDDPAAVEAFVADLEFLESLGFWS